MIQKIVSLSSLTTQCMWVVDVTKTQTAWVNLDAWLRDIEGHGGGLVIWKGAVMVFLAGKNNLELREEMRTIESLRGQLFRKEIWSLKWQEILLFKWNEVSVFRTKSSEDFKLMIMLIIIISNMCQALFSVLCVDLQIVSFWNSPQPYEVKTIIIPTL